MLIYVFIAYKILIFELIYLHYRIKSDLKREMQSKSDMELNMQSGVFLKFYVHMLFDIQFDSIVFE